MNLPLILTTMKRIALRPWGLVLILFYVLVGTMLISELSVKTDVTRVSLASSVGLFTWLLGTGLIGSDLSGGILPLLFSRPLKRSAYVLSRWAGLVGVVALASLAALVCHALFGSATLASLTWGALALAVSIAAAALAGATIVLCSCVFSGHGDAGLALGSLVLGWLIYPLTRRADWVSAFYRGANTFFLPGSDALKALAEQDQSLALTWLGAHLLIALACLWGAVQVMERRDISYVNA